MKDPLPISNVLKWRQNFAWVYIIMVILAIYLLTEKIYKFKTDHKNVNFPIQFSVWTMSENFDYVKQDEVSLRGSVYDFLVGCNPIDKSEILNMLTRGYLTSLPSLIFVKKFSNTPALIRTSLLIKSSTFWEEVVSHLQEKKLVKYKIYF